MKFDIDTYDSLKTKDERRDFVLQSLLQLEKYELRLNAVPLEEEIIESQIKYLHAKSQLEDLTPDDIKSLDTLVKLKKITQEKSVKTIEAQARSLDAPAKKQEIKQLLELVKKV